MTSTYDTPLPESDFDDDQIRAQLASPLYLQEGERQVRTDDRFVTLEENT